jgi:formate dehydrogenase maturation protein FdhE
MPTCEKCGKTADWDGDFLPKGWGESEGDHFCPDCWTPIVAALKAAGGIVEWTCRRCGEINSFIHVECRNCREMDSIDFAELREMFEIDHERDHRKNDR